MKYESTQGMKAFEPFNIKSMHLKNRLGIGPYGSHPSAKDGSPNELTVKYYEQLAATGFGFIMVGIVNPIPKNLLPNYSSRVNIHISEDNDIEGWRKVTDAIHAHGCCCGIQLGLFGLINCNYLSELEGDLKKYAFNDMSTGATNTQLPPGNILTKEDMHKIIEYSGLAAGRAKAAGFDCISVHNAHSDIMLGACSLDPMFNNRDDEYGGPIEGRLRYTVELIKEMRKNVGPDYPITMRINGDDLKDELGNSLEDICKYIIPELEKAGLRRHRRIAGRLYVRGSRMFARVVLSSSLLDLHLLYDQEVRYCSSIRCRARNQHRDGGEDSARRKSGHFLYWS